MKNSYLTLMFVVSIVVLLGVGFVAANPFGKRAPVNISIETLEAMNGERIAMQTAIENKDFGAWKLLMEDRIAKMQSEITEENFNKIVEMHTEMSQHMKEMKSGNFTRFKEDFRFHEKGKGMMPRPSD